MSWGHPSLSPRKIKRVFDSLEKGLATGLAVFPGDTGGIEAGADDVESDEEGHYITTTFEAMVEVAAALEKVLGEAESVKAVWKPQTNTPIDADKGASLMKLIATLEEDDDVQNVYTNFEMSDEDAAKLDA